MIIQRRGTILSYIIGWCIIIPIALVFPYELLEVLQVESLVIKMAFVTPSTIVFFRCIEAMYDTSPHTVETNLGTYCIYYSSLLHFEWNKITATRKTISIQQVGVTVMKVIGIKLGLSIICSFLLHTNFKPFPSSISYTDYHLDNIIELLQPSHILNAYLCGILVFLTLHFGFTMTAFGDEIKGFVYTKPSFLNPLYTSTSPSDFWNKKWNLMIHRILKYGCYLPTYKNIKSKYISIAFTFFISGLLHEYTNSIMFYHRRELRNPITGICDDCYQYKYGKLLAFFTWNGIVMLLERPFAKYLFANRQPQLPIPIISTLVVLTALPVGHWYFGDWIAGQYFHHLSIGLWTIRKVT